MRKTGVLSDAKTGHFSLQDGDYKLYPFHMVSLYSIHPKEARLRKRVILTKLWPVCVYVLQISYVMDTDTKAIISHVMIMYDYNTEGPIPHVSGPYGKRNVRRRLRRIVG